MDNREYAGPLSRMLRQALRYLNAPGRNCPEFVDRTLNTAIQRIELNEAERGRLVRAMTEIRSLRQTEDYLENEISSLVDELTEAAGKMDELSERIYEQSEKIEKLEGDLNERDEYIDYLLIRLERYTGLPKDDFYFRYLRWCEAKTREIELKEQAKNQENSPSRGL
ncbi:uncharacterized protein LOC128388663 [Panonychus citri]|uniref:uncharacterized protein LOC128388663 n=1 Tax=Panonychus citri TaxID=50023 RepID=UPI00230772DC|nr:uncharacterized protein LOC128388663 [Panonychus citri]